MRLHTAALLHRARRLTRLARHLVRSGPASTRVGRCEICRPWGEGARALFVVEGASLRETTLCMRCRSNARNRAVMRCLGLVCPDWRDRVIFEAGASGSLRRALERACPGHIPSIFDPETARGSVSGGLRSEDLQELTLEDDSVDVVLSEDVLEHVYDAERAFAEIARVLRPGVVHIFTVPYFRDAPTTRTRAELAADGQVHHLLPPEYHGDPLDPEGALVVHDFGRDLPELIERCSGLRTIELTVRDARSGILEPCPVFLSH